jgi:uncharacterized membrane protein YuzA (DUF378 family)
MKDFLRPLLIGSVLVAISIVSRSEILLIPGLALVLPSLGGIAFEFLGLLENKFGTKFSIFLMSWFLSYAIFVYGLAKKGSLPKDFFEFIIDALTALVLTIFTYPLVSAFFGNPGSNDKNSEKDNF